jgi:cytochrome c biogenesis protein CcdA/thiol-disulfide isomerase/thioredoxin
LVRKQGLIITLALLLALIAVPVVQAQGEEPAIKGYLFYSTSCEDCHEIRTEIIPPLYQEFRYRLQILAIDINDETNHQWLLAFEKAYGVPENEADIPEFFIGDRYLIGKQAIQENLEPLVREYMAGKSADSPNVPRPGGPLQPTVKFIFFYSPNCGHCKYVEENVFPKLKEKYGERVQWEAHSTSQEVNYRALLILGEVAGLPPERRGGVPVVFIGDEFSVYSLFIGSGDIPAYLERTVDWFMAIGGVDFPAWKEELFRVALTPPPTAPLPTQAPTSTATQPAASATPSTAPEKTPPPAKPPIHMAYFGELGCSECDRVTIALEHLKNRFPNLVIHEFDVLEDLSINLCLAERLNVPENRRHDAPAVFVGSDYLVDTDIHDESLTELVSKYAETGAEPAWEGCTDQDTSLPPPPPWWAVILPGLADGINPCAFATIIFFVSYLSIIRRKGKDIIMVGISFALAVFLSYLGFGMILREIFAGLIDVVGPVLRPILNALTAVLCLVLAVLSFDDFWKARQGNVKDMALQLPHKLRMWINASIRQSMRSDTLITASFVSGVVVSFIELACTGQVYVPIIQGLSNPGYRAQSTLDLIVYCLAFAIPLIVVFILSYMGTSSKQLTRFFDQYAAPIKLVMTVLFVGIGLWLIYDVLRIWGVISPLTL